MASKTKDLIIQELTETVEQYKKSCEAVQKRNEELVERADEDFTNSAYKCQLESERDFYKQTETMARINYDAMKARVLKQGETIRTMQAGNTKTTPMDNYEITVEEIAQEEIIEENCRLRAKLENREEKIEFLMQEIARLQGEIAVLGLDKIA